MYHPSKYDEHNKSLNKFSLLFNSHSKENGNRLVVKINETETFRDDGYIFDSSNSTKLGFDWEKRVSYYINYGFPFEDFGQFERKIKKPEIKLSIQCSKNENGFCIAWHEDFLKEIQKNIGSKMENGRKEFTPKRFTKKFKEFSYDEINKFYSILLNAFDTKNFHF